MESSAKRAALVAVDLGAQSCRVSLLRWKQGRPRINVIHRFPNAPIATQEGLRWDIGRIFDGVKDGLRLCADVAPEGIASLGVDGWAVDYVRLDGNGEALADPFCYRDERTHEAEKNVHQIISPSRLYSLTGIQLLGLNTLYQLYADKLAGRSPSTAWLNVPEYVTYCLGGRRVAEYTNATHTQLVRVGGQEWCDEIFQGLGLDISAAPNIVPTGSIVGSIGGDLSKLPALRDTKLIVPACHDTASAIAAIPASGEDWAFISSGTWSLVGTVLKTPCVSDEARGMNFTNLGGAGRSICFLKNVNGMWLLRQCIDEWEERGTTVSVNELVLECETLRAPDFLIDVDDPPLTLPGDMLGKINGQLRRAGHRPFTSENGDIPLIANTIFHSMAERYAEVLECIAAIAGKRLKRLFIVGGGSKNTLLNRLTAERTGLEVLLGSTESTTLGNFAIQMAALQGSWNDTTGLAASAVAQWAEEFAESVFEEARNRETV
ncbi:MAG: rhamnulokinase family protein [Candidatus Acidiferrales bacterium]